MIQQFSSDILSQGNFFSFMVHATKSQGSIFFIHLSTTSFAKRDDVIHFISLKNEQIFSRCIRLPLCFSKVSTSFSVGNKLVVYSLFVTIECRIRIDNTITEYLSCESTVFEYVSSLFQYLRHLRQILRFIFPIYIGRSEISSLILGNPDFTHPHPTPPSI